MPGVKKTTEEKHLIILNLSQRRILKFLQNYADPETGQCTPSMKEIATALHLSRGYVHDLISDLVSKHIIEREERWEELPDETGFYRASNLYRIMDSHGRAIMSTWRWWWDSAVLQST